MEGFVEPEFLDQFNERRTDYYDTWKPVVKFSCNYCNPLDAGYTDRIVHNQIVHNSLQNPILTEIIQALWGSDDNQKD